MVLLSLLLTLLLLLLESLGWLLLLLELLDIKFLELIELEFKILLELEFTESLNLSWLEFGILHAELLESKLPELEIVRIEGKSVKSGKADLNYFSFMQ